MHRSWLVNQGRASARVNTKDCCPLHARESGDDVLALGAISIPAVGVYAVVTAIAPTRHAAWAAGASYWSWAWPRSASGAARRCSLGSTTRYAHVARDDDPAFRPESKHPLLVWRIALEAITQVNGLDPLSSCKLSHSTGQSDRYTVVEEESHLRAMRELELHGFSN